MLSVVRLLFWLLFALLFVKAMEVELPDNYENSDNVAAFYQGLFSDNPYVVRGSLEGLTFHLQTVTEPFPLELVQSLKTNLSGLIKLSYNEVTGLSAIRLINQLSSVMALPIVEELLVLLHQAVNDRTSAEARGMAVQILGNLAVFDLDNRNALIHMGLFKIFDGLLQGEPDLTVISRVVEAFCKVISSLPLLPFPCYHETFMLVVQLLKEDPRQEIGLVHGSVLALIKKLATKDDVIRYLISIDGFLQRLLQLAPSFTSEVISIFSGFVAKSDSAIMAIRDVGGFDFLSFYTCNAINEDDQIEAINALTYILVGVPDYADQLVSSPVITCLFAAIASPNQELAQESVYCLREFQPKLSQADFLISHKFPCHALQYLHNVVSVQGPVLVDESVVKMVFELLKVCWMGAREQASAMLVGSDADIAGLLERCFEKIPYDSVKEMILTLRSQLS